MKKAKVTALLLSASIMSGLCFQNVYADEGNEADKALFTLCFDGNKNEKLIESEFKNIFEKRYKEAGVLYLYEKGKNLYVGVTHPDCFLANYRSVFSADKYKKIYIFKSQCNWVWNNNIVSFTKEEATKIEELNDEKIEIITATYVDSYRLDKVKKEKEEAVREAEEIANEAKKAQKDAEERADTAKKAQKDAEERAGEAKKEKEKAVREAKEKAREAEAKAAKKVIEVQESAEKIANEAKIAQKKAEENARIANDAKDEAVKGKKSAVRDKYVILATSGVFVALENLYLIFQDEVTQAYNWSKGLVSHFFNLLKK